ncbi:MAG: GrpB family protein [Candidatus Jacksonbacteria bacterium]
MTQKIKLFPYSKKFPKLFEKEKKLILKLIPNCEIHHIGSTSVPGLGGKGIIDILIVLKRWGQEQVVIKKLKTLGFAHIHPRSKGRRFLSRIKDTQYGDTHIQIMLKHSKPCREFINFRDHLRKHSKEAKKYYKFKKFCLDYYQGNRDYYRLVKGGYVLQVLQKIKK